MPSETEIGNPISHTQDQIHTRPIDKGPWYKEDHRNTGKGWIEGGLTTVEPFLTQANNTLNATAAKQSTKRGMGEEYYGQIDKLIFILSFFLAIDEKVVEVFRSAMVSEFNGG